MKNKKVLSLSDYERMRFGFIVGSPSAFGIVIEAPQPAALNIANPLPL